MSIEKALLDCIEHPSDGAVSCLRRLLEPALVARLSNLSIDGRVIRQALDETFRLFTSTVTPSRKINWLAWIAANALAFVAELTNSLSWVDQFSVNLPLGHERRAGVFRVLLTLDGNCQWHLLKIARGAPGTPGLCEQELIARLSRL